MPTEIDHSSAQTQAAPALEEVVRLLAEELRAVRRESRRQRRLLRLMSVALITTLVLVGWSARSLFPTAQAQLQSQHQPIMTPEERKARREELLAALPVETQQELESFQRQVDWLNRYMQTWEEGTAGAVISLMLYRMSQNMSVMPSMEQQMRTMSVQMGALPAIVAELDQINAKMTLISGTMDSTMGRAGRMMPWMPFMP